MADEPLNQKVTFVTIYKLGHIVTLGFLNYI